LEIFGRFAKYHEKYNRTILQAINSETSGDFYHGLLGLGEKLLV